MLESLYAPATHALLRLLGGRRIVLEGEGVRLVAHRLGPREGEPWVLLPGLGATALTWGPVARRLRRERPVLLPELSRLGGTRSQRAALSVGEAVAAVARLLERELDGRPAVVAGVSLGGWIAVRLALARPELVARLVLLDAAGWRDQDWERVRALVTVETPEQARRFLAALFRRPPLWARLGERFLLAALRSPAVRAVLETTSERDAYVGEDLARIAVPALVVWGEHDGIFPAEVGRRMAEALPQGRFELLPGAGHAAQWEAPRAVLRALREFASEGDGRRPAAAV